MLTVVAFLFWQDSYTLLKGTVKAILTTEQLPLDGAIVLRTKLRRHFEEEVGSPVVLGYFLS